jgi:hypothetical protein
VEEGLCQQIHGEEGQKRKKKKVQVVLRSVELSGPTPS